MYSFTFNSERNNAPFIPHMWLIVDEEIRFLKHKHVVIYTEETLWEFKPVKRVVKKH